MIFSEPPRSQYDLHFSVLGIPVRVHPFFWVAGLLLGLNGNQRPAEMAMWLATFFVSIIVHELGHALAARAHGWEPHITLHGFGGLASYRPTYHSTRAQLLITLAGPGAGFALAAAVLAGIVSTGHEVSFDFGYGLLPVRFEGFDSRNLNMLLSDLLFINIFWGLVNLLPVYPLDGGQIARELLEVANPSDGMRQALWLSVVTGVGLAVLAVVRLHDQFLAVFFGYLAYSSYMTLQQYFGPGGGLGRFR